MVVEDLFTCIYGVSGTLFVYENSLPLKTIDSAEQYKAIQFSTNPSVKMDKYLSGFVEKFLPYLSQLISFVVLSQSFCVLHFVPSSSSLYEYIQQYNLWRNDAHLCLLSA